MPTTITGGTSTDTTAGGTGTDTTVGGTSTITAGTGTDTTVGGTGTSITLVDAANGFAPLGSTVRHTDLSGDLIDQALLTHIINDLSAAGTIDLAGTSAIGSRPCSRMRRMTSSRSNDIPRRSGPSACRSGWRVSSRVVTGFRLSIYCRRIASRRSTMSCLRKFPSI